METIMLNNCIEMPILGFGVHQQMIAQDACEML